MARLLNILNKETIKTIITNSGIEDDPFRIEMHIRNSAAMWYSFHMKNIYNDKFFDTKMKSKYSKTVYEDLIWWQKEKYEKNPYSHITNLFQVDFEDMGYKQNRKYFDDRIYNASYTNIYIKPLVNNVRFDDCWKVTYKDWQQLLSFTRDFYNLFCYFNNILYKSFMKPHIKKIKKTLFLIIQKHSCMTIQHHVRIFLLKRRISKRKICQFINENAFIPNGLLCKFYYKRFLSNKNKILNLSFHPQGYECF